MKIIADLGKLDRNHNVIVIQKADRFEYIIAENYNPEGPEGNKWDRGAYCYSLEGLAQEILNKSKDIAVGYDRMCEIATGALHKVIESDGAELAYDFFRGYEMDMDAKELEFFGCVRNRVASYIEWDIDEDEEPNNDLPTEVKIPEEIDDDDIADYLANEYGYCVNDYSIEEDE